MYRILNPTIAEYTFFSSAHGTFAISWDKKQTSTNLKKLKTMQTMFSDHHGIKLEINNRTRKSLNWKLNNTFLNTAWVKKLVSKEIKNTQT